MAIFQQVPRAASAADEAIALARGVAGKAAPSAGARGVSMLGKTYQAEIQSLAEMLKHPSAVNNPANAAKVWDDIYAEIAKNAKFQGKPIGPGAGSVTYKMPDGSLKTLSITERPPVGAERISLTDAELRAMMPPRPTPPAEAAAKAPHSYDAPRPPGMEPPVSPATRAQEAVDIAKNVTGGPAPTPPRAAPWGAPPAQSAPSVPSVRPSASPEPDALLKYGVGVPAAAAGAGAVGTGVMYGYDPEMTQKAIQTAKSVYGIEPDYNPAGSIGDTMVNPPMMAYQGPGVSADQSDFVSDNMPERFRESAVSYDQSDFFPQPETQYSWRGPLADRLPTGGTSNLTATRGRPAASVSSSQTTADAAPQPAQSSAEMSPLAYFLRGRFGEAAKEDPNKLTAYQLARDEQDRTRAGSMASGGKVDKPPKDAALHKALEIIHNLISRG